jgi:hypothetical protein
MVVKSFIAWGLGYGKVQIRNLVDLCGFLEDPAIWKKKILSFQKIYFGK